MSIGALITFETVTLVEELAAFFAVVGGGKRARVPFGRCFALLALADLALLLGTLVLISRAIASLS